MSKNERSPLISVRTAVVLLLSGLAGAASFKLSMLAGETVASSAMIAGAALAGAIYLFNSILSDR